MKKHKLVHWLIGMLGITMIVLTLFDLSRNSLERVVLISGTIIALCSLFVLLVTIPKLQEKKDHKHSPFNIQSHV